jgi:hypothetical protein
VERSVYIAGAPRVSVNTHVSENGDYECKKLCKVKTCKSFCTSSVVTSLNSTNSGMRVWRVCTSNTKAIRQYLSS